MNATQEQNNGSKLPILVGQRGLELRTIDDMWRFAQWVVKSGFAPKGTTAEGAVVAMAMGMEIGLPAMQSIQNIAVINGRPSVWGDAIPGLIQASKNCEYMKEWFTGTYPKDDFTAHCEMKRKDMDVVFSGEFSIADAKKAGLWGKQGPWQHYDKRMLKMRARAFPARDGFADVLKGLQLREEVEDIPRETVDVTNSVSDLDDLAESIKRQSGNGEPDVVIDVPVAEPEQSDEPAQAVEDEPVENAPEMTVAAFDPAPLIDFLQNEIKTRKVPSAVYDGWLEQVGVLDAGTPLEELNQEQLESLVEFVSNYDPPKASKKK